MFSGSDHLNQYTFTHLTINGKYIDNEKKIIKGNQLKASVSVTNSTDAEFSQFGEFLILNADSLYEEASLHRKEMVIGAGQTYAAEGEQTIDAKWKKVVFSFRFKHDGFINDEIFTDVYTVQPVIYTFTKDGEERRHDECEVFETPEDAMLVMLQNT